MPRKDLVSYSAKKGYRKHPGMVMWLFHRISGVIIGLFLIFHMLGISGVCPFMGEFVKTRIIVSLVAVLFVLHAANGIRIILMEFAGSAERHKFLPHLIATVAVVAVVGGVFAFRLLLGAS